jgi:hypothetical protein
MRSVHILALLTLAALLPITISAQTVPAAQVETIAKSAYVYGFPLVDLYRIMFGYFIDPKSPAHVAPFNTLHNSANVYTPADTTVQTPNSDTPYSFVGLDLRAEPMVLTMPPIQKNRYYSAQFVDQYTYNIGYAGSRTTGNGGSTILMVGPNWHGATPTGITKVIHFDTEFGMVGIRTQLFNTADLPNVKKIQAGYRAQPLSAYLHKVAPPATPTVQWIPALSPTAERSSKMFDVLAFILQFAPTPSSESALRQQFSSIGIHAGKPFSAGANSAPYMLGVKAGQQEIDKARAALTTTTGLFGTPEAMHNNYLNRAIGAQYGILGNSAAEAVYLGYQKDSNGTPLSGAHNYTVHFAKGQLPPAKAFWSLTMYDLPQQLLVANPINRYLINSPMLPNLKRDADGGITLYVQHSSPGATKESNWLPAPAGPFMNILRIYWPEQTPIDGTWKQPPMVLVN